LPFLLAPMLAVLLSWWMVHKHAPHLIIWVIFGVAAGSLPGQIFVINDSIFQQHLFWPIFMSLFVPLTWPKRIVLFICAAFQFVHPLGVMLFCGATVGALLMAIVDVENRRRLLVRAGFMAALLLLTTSKIYITSRIPSLYDDYAADEAKFSTAIDRWNVGVKGWPLHGLWFMWSAAAMLLVWSRLRWRITPTTVLRLFIALCIALGVIAWEYREQPMEGIYGAVACILFFVFVRQFRKPDGPNAGLAILPMLCIATAALFWIHWAGDGRLWWKAIDYRRWVGPLTAPFFLFALLDALAEAKERNRKTDAPSPTPAWGFPVVLPDTAPPQSEFAATAEGSANIPARRSIRGSLALLLAMTFAFVLGLQSTVWHEYSVKLMDAVWQYPATIVPASALPWIDGTPLDHWAVSDYVMAMQGKTPKKLLLYPPAEENIYQTPPKIPHWDFYPGARKNHSDPTPGPVGWFDLRPLLKQLESEPRPKGILGPERLDAKSTPQ
jgi:hypothetical protein